MDDFMWMGLLENRENQMLELMEYNQYTQKFGLLLTEENALQLIKARKEILKEQERIEFGEGVLTKLIFAFCDSAYIHQDNYVDTIETLQNIFYLYKNESLDELTDDELIEYMKTNFEGGCYGSLEYLEDTCLEDFAREIRKGTRKYIGKYEDVNEQL